jgi:hypothetical protein
MSVLIVTMPADYHSHAVKWAIEGRGHECEMLYPLDLADGASWSWSHDDQTLRVEHGDSSQVIDFSKIETVWMRRPPGIIPQERLADLHERSVAEQELAVTVHSVLKFLDCRAFTVNPFTQTQAAALKPFQFAVARDLGLRMPRTLVSNSREDILAFFETCGGRMVYKTLSTALWLTKDRNFAVVPTTEITDSETLETCDLAGAPGIFQEVIRKSVEIRATVMGRSIFAWEKSFATRDPATIDIDWRWMYTDATHRRHDLPQSIKDKCFSLLDRLGLVFGCFDFVLDEGGEYIFLEVNPQGQWLWGDMLGCEIDQLDAMAAFLLSRDPQFRYAGDSTPKLSDYPGEDFSAAQVAEQAEHYGNVLTFHYERVSRPVSFENLLSSAAAAG